MSDIVVGIDIGTSKVCTVIGQVGKSSEPELIGEGMESCTGIKKGVIIDIESVARAVRSSVERAEAATGFKVGSAYVNIIGMHVSVLDYKSSSDISGDDREVIQKDIDKLLYNVKNLELSDDKQIIDIVPRQYIIDGYDEIVDPVGMVGNKLEVEADVIAGKITSVQNIVKSIEKADIKIDGLIVESMATAEMALTNEEKEIGVVLIDVGAQVTDISVFRNNRLIFNDSIPVGGEHITNDVSIGLKISRDDAEKLKRQYELALTSLIKNDQEILVTEINENKKKSVKVSEIVEIIEARVYEILSLCSNSISKSGLAGNFAAGIVLAGGGISHIDGGRQLATEVFDLPARVACPKLNGITKAEYMTAAGIIKFVNKTRKDTCTISEIKRKREAPKEKGTGLFGRLSNFIKRMS